MILLAPFSVVIANKSITDEGKAVNKISVSGFTVKVSENGAYVFLFVHKNNHTIFATKFSK